MISAPVISFLCPTPRGGKRKYGLDQDLFFWGTESKHNSIMNIKSHDQKLNRHSLLKAHTGNSNSHPRAFHRLVVRQPPYGQCPRFFSATFPTTLDSYKLVKPLFKWEQDSYFNKIKSMIRRLNSRINSYWLFSTWSANSYRAIEPTQPETRAVCIICTEIVKKNRRKSGEIYESCTMCPGK